jgi:hypothetical protein
VIANPRENPAADFFSNFLTVEKLDLAVRPAVDGRMAHGSMTDNDLKPILMTSPDRHAASEKWPSRPFNSPVTQTEVNVYTITRNLFY